MNLHGFFIFCGALWFAFLVKMAVQPGIGRVVCWGTAVMSGWYYTYLASRRRIYPFAPYAEITSVRECDSPIFIAPLYRGRTETDADFLNTAVKRLEKQVRAKADSKKYRLITYPTYVARLMDKTNWGSTSHHSYHFIGYLLENTVFCMENAGMWHDWYRVWREC